jgi:protein-tyrosine phosphatase
LLIEMPHGLVVDLRHTVTKLRQQGIRPILAHPERHQELLDDTGRMEELIQLGCLVQVSTKSIADSPNWRQARTLKDWLKRGLVHVLGSDGHSPRREPPLMQQAYQQIVHWAGAAVADRVGSTNGLAIAGGLPLHLAPIVPRRRTRTLFPAWLFRGMVC